MICLLTTVPEHVYNKENDLDAGDYSTRLQLAVSALLINNKMIQEHYLAENNLPSLNIPEIQETDGISMARVGGFATISPDGNHSFFHIYQFEAANPGNFVWVADCKDIVKISLEEQSDLKIAYADMLDMEQCTTYTKFNGLLHALSCMQKAIPLQHHNLSSMLTDNTNVALVSLSGIENFVERMRTTVTKAIADDTSGIMGA